ncbi:insulinase family protein, partial [Lysinibacillus sp. NPDC056959]|uniref:insulinase family protein n=1 Tax=Lysinibacillus sp. NPDC056959 TaxID=3345981 RepID=UPI00363C05F5
ILYLKINKAPFSFYDLTIYISSPLNYNIEDINNKFLISNILSLYYEEINNIFYKVYPRIIRIDNNFYSILYIDAINEKYIDGKLKIKEFLSLDEKSFYNKLLEAKNKQIQKITRYHSNPLNYTRSLIKDQLFNDLLIGTQRHGSINGINEEINIDLLYEYFMKIREDKNIFCEIKENNIKMRKNNIFNSKLNTIQKKDIAIKKNSLNGQQINTICFYFKESNSHSKYILGPMIQCLLSQYGHSLLFKTLRINNFQLYHFEAHFDEDTDLLFIQFTSEKNQIKEIYKSIIYSFHNLKLNENILNELKVFLSNEYRYKFQKKYGLVNFYLKCGNSIEYMNNIFEVIENVTLDELIKYLSDSDLILIKEEDNL